MSKLIRVNDKTFKKLAKVCGGMQVRGGGFASVDDALSYLLAKNNGSLKRFWAGFRKKKRI